MGWMGLVGGALQGAGKGGMEYFKGELENENAIERAQATINMKRAAEDSEREAKRDRIMAAREGIINDTLARKGGNRGDLETDPDIWAKAGMQTGDLDIDKVIAMVKADRQAAIEARKLSRLEARDAHREKVDDLRLELQQRGLDIQNRRVDAMIAKLSSGGGAGSNSANVEWYDKIKKETGWDPDKILTYMSTAKTPVPTEKETVEDDGLGNKKRKVTTTGPAVAPKKPSIDVDNLFPSRK